MFEEMFSHIREQAIKAGFVIEDNLYIDSTHIKANKHKFTKEITYGQAKSLSRRIRSEINVQRVATGKRPLAYL